MNILQHRANEAIAKISNARTPQERLEARQEGLAVRADLEKFVADDQALKAFRKAKPQNSYGVYGSGTGRVIFMVPAGGKTQTAPGTLPDGTKVVPVQNQIAVPDNMVGAMMGRGWIRANSVLTDLSSALGMSDPARPNNS
jgi:hypothetical protein